ncbi:hypothetical protein GCM10027419_52870 [Pandoraea terrae]
MKVRGARLTRIATAAAPLRALQAGAAMTGAIAAIAGMITMAGTAHAQGNASQAAAVPSLGGAGIVQTGLGLAVVLAVLFGLAWLAKRFGLQRPLGSGQVRVVGSAAVGQRERVVVVEIAGDWVVIGVAPGRVSALHTIDADRVAALPPVSPGAPAGAQANRAAQAFAQKLRQSMQKDS